jgi:hypothetical protein
MRHPFVEFFEGPADVPDENDPEKSGKKSCYICRQEWAKHQETTEQFMTRMFKEKNSIVETEQVGVMRSLTLGLMQRL